MSLGSLGIPGKGLPGAAPSIVSSARGTTAIAWRRKETQTREKEGARSRAVQGAGQGLLPRWPPATTGLPHHLLSPPGSPLGLRRPSGDGPGARPTTPHLRDQTPAQLCTYPEEDLSRMGGRGCPQAWPDDRQECAGRNPPALRMVRRRTGLKSATGKVRAASQARRLTFSAPLIFNVGYRTHSTGSWTGIQEG